MFNGRTDNYELIRWVADVAQHTMPDFVKWCDGTERERNAIEHLLIDNGTFIPLNPEKRPASFLARSDPRDVARVEDRTFICSEREEDAGITNNWHDPVDMKLRLWTKLRGCMRGRTMYVVPFSMGPIGGPISQIGVEITDSPYVVASMRIMTRMSQAVLNELGRDGEFVKGLHTVASPLMPGEPDVPWPCCPNDIIVAHFPESQEIISYGSGYGGNALLGKKCYALRIASVQARDEGWLAEHMMILKIKPPKEYGPPIYVTGAFPSACGKTNLAMVESAIPGWEFETIGDDIAWMKPEDGVLYAINPEFGFFGVAPGTSYATNANAMESMKSHTIFTNVALTDDGDVWWEGMTEDKPDHLIDWHGNSVYLNHSTQVYELDDATFGEVAKVAHPNSRFTSPTMNCPSLAPEYHDPEGVPISAMLFGGRRPSTIPLVTEARNWTEGVFMAATISSETTAAAKGKVGELRFDPMAMKPFIGYNAADYFQHWLDMGYYLEHDFAGGQPPRIYRVNWFRKDADGKFIWPGFSENTRVLKWIYDRVMEKRLGLRTNNSPFGFVPQCGAIAPDDINREKLRSIVNSDAEDFKAEREKVAEYLQSFGDRLPTELWLVAANG